VPRVGGDAVDDQVLLDDMGRFRKRGVGRSFVACLIEIRLVVRAIVVELRRPLLEGVSRRNNRGPRRIIDLDALRCIAGKLERIGDHDRHRIADMQHAADRDGRAVRQIHRAAVAFLVWGHRRHRAETVGLVVLSGQDGVNAWHL
jgi:hypothetical protein